MKNWCYNCCSSSEGRVPLWKKLAYAVGSMPYSITNIVIGTFFYIFLLEVVIMDPIYVTVIVFSGYLWDAITDPGIGFLTSHTKTRFGRLRIWMALAMVPAAIAYFFVWFVPSLDNKPQYVKFIYYLIFYFAFRVSMSGIYVPYTSLIMHISNDNKKRDSVIFYRICFEQTGNIIGMLIFNVFYSALAHPSKGCNMGKRVPDPQTRAAYQWHALTIAVLIVVFVIITVTVVREQKDQIEKSKSVNLLKGIKEICGFRPFFYFVMLNGLNWLAFQILQSNIVLYMKYSVGIKKDFPFIAALFTISSVIWTIPFKIMAEKCGKKTTYFIGMWIFMPLFIILLYLNYFPLGAYIGAPFLGSGAACTYLLSWSMLPDVVDEAALVNGVRREELFYGFFVFVTKLAMGLGAGVSLIFYKIAGYNENACEQPWTVALTLKLLVAVPPILIILTSLIFLHFYPITEETRMRTKRLLAERRAHIMDNGNSEGLTSAQLSSTKPVPDEDP